MELYQKNLKKLEETIFKNYNILLYLGKMSAIIEAENFQFNSY